MGLRGWRFGAVFLLVATVPAAAQVQRDPYAARWWYGAVDYAHASSSGIILNGGNVAAGWRPSRYFGLEIGDSLSSVSGVTVNNAYVDALTFLPLGRRFSLFVSGGSGYATESADAGSLGTISVSRAGWRAGGGFELRLTKRIDLRASYHRQSAWNDVDIVTTGLAFRF